MPVTPTSAVGRQGLPSIGHGTWRASWAGPLSATVANEATPSDWWVIAVENGPSIRRLDARQLGLGRNMRLLREVDLCPVRVVALNEVEHAEGVVTG